jgi:transcriptional regulator with GAF, ATPase, and Fis domain
VESPQQFIDSLDAGVLALDPQATVVGANAAARRSLGPACREGALLTELIDGAERIAAEIGAGLGVGGMSGRVTARALRVRSDDGARYVDVTVVPEIGWPGEAVALATLHDATARVESDAEAARLRERLAESEAARAKMRTVQQELNEQGPDGPPTLVGSSQALKRVRVQISRVAGTDTTVLIQGETGTGKELVARSIHFESPRSARPFIAINCAALPESLIESELFGHERGAFTGADRRRLGKFELAEEGTIFLDEIAELPLPAQAKLLRFLQGGTFERVGGAETLRSSARVVAATHRELARRVERGLFREDLYYRLNVFRIEVPPLRDRREDLRELVEHLHLRVARRMARPVLPISERSVRRIMAYRWPGNIRELANAVERATLLADGPELEIELPDSPGPGAATPAPGGAPTTPTRDILLDLTLEQLQRLHIMHALESTEYRVFGPGGAADKLDINPNTLLSRMDRFGIPRPRLARRAGDGSGS